MRNHLFIKMEYLLIRSYGRKECPIKVGDIWYSVSKPNQIESLLTDEKILEEYKWVTFDFDYQAPCSAFLIIGNSKPVPTDPLPEDATNILHFLSSVSMFYMVSPRSVLNDVSRETYDFTIQMILPIISLETTTLLTEAGVDLAVGDHFYLRMAIAYLSILTMKAIRPHIDLLTAPNWDIITTPIKQFKKSYSPVTISDPESRLEVIKYLCHMFESFPDALSVALIQAIKSSSEMALDLCKYMIENAIDSMDSLSLILKFSVENGCHLVAKYLIEYGVDVHSADEAIFRPNYQLNPEFLRFLIKEGWSPGKKAREVMSNYIWVFSVEDLEFFVANGLDLSKLNISMICLRIGDKNRFDIVKLLDKLDVDIGSEQFFLLDLFISANNIEAVEFLCDSYEGMQYPNQYTLDMCLCLATSRDRMELVKIFMKRGAQVFGERHGSSLIPAIYILNVEILSYLWENGINLGEIPSNDRIFRAMAFIEMGHVKFHSVLVFVTEIMGIDLNVDNEELISFIRSPERNSYVESRCYLADRVKGLDDFIGS